MSEYYDKILEKYKQKRIKEIETEICNLQNEINNLHELEDFQDELLISTKDRKQILDYFNSNLSKKDFEKVCCQAISMFGHVDNIRYVCVHYNIPCPEWYMEKYAKLFT